MPGLDRNRPWRKLYGRRWQVARKAYLQRNPLCAMCATVGRVTVATVVDHVRRHNGDPSLFWDQGNWQPLCQPHHDSDKQSAEAREATAQPTCTPDGYPADGSW